MSEILGLRAGDTVAEVAPLGGELRRLRIGGLEFIRAPDSSWPATSPVLFPVVGWARDGAVRLGDRRFPMPVHGFAAGCRFTPEPLSGDHLRLRLVDDAATRRHFPFAFGLALDYRLAEDGLAVTLEVANPGAGPMPYACGFHPGFRWPFAGGAPEEYRIVFDAEERPEVPVIAPGGLFAPERRSIPLEGRELSLTSALMSREALCLLEARSRGLVFGRRSGPQLRLDFENFPHLALWSLPPSPFLSIEAWTGHGDPVGFTGDLFEKPSMRVLMPGESARHGMRIGLLA